MSKEQKEAGALRALLLARVAAGIALCAGVLLLDVAQPYSLILMALGGLIAGGDLLLAGIIGFLREEYFNRNTTLLAVFIISHIVGVGYEGSLLLILTQVGILLTEYVRKVVRKHIFSLTGLSFQTAHVFRGGLLTDNFVGELEQGDEIIVKAGEYFPVDCVVTEGHSTVRPQLIDAKCVERAINVGDGVLAGSMNLGADLRCEVTSAGAGTAADILEVLRRGEETEMPMLMCWFQPAMYVFAFLVGILLVVLTEVQAYEAVHRALAVLVLSGAASAYSGFADIRFAARAGAAVRGAVFASDEVFTGIGRSDSAVICADGIMTEGKLHVTAAYSESMDEEAFLRIAAHAMFYAKDPAAEAIMNAYNGDIVYDDISDFREIPNCGVMVKYQDVAVVLGTQALMASVKGMLPQKMSADRQMMFMLYGKEYAGYFVLTDPISDLTGTVPADLAWCGIEEVQFVTSYSGETAEKIAAKSGIETYEAGLTCDERMQYVEQHCEGFAGQSVYIFTHKYAAEEHSAAYYDVYVGGSTRQLLEGRAEVVVPTGRKEAVFEGLRAAKCAQRMCTATMYVMLVLKLLLVVLAGAGLVTVWFAAAFELIACLFVKVFSTGAFEEKTLDRYDNRKKEKV